MDGFGEAIASAFFGMIFIAVVVTAVIVGCGTYVATRYMTPTPESIQRAADRQAAIDSLTPEQRKVLGF